MLFTFVEADPNPNPFLPPIALEIYLSTESYLNQSEVVQPLVLAKN